MSLAQGNNTPTRPRIEPGSPDPESDALTIRPVRPPEIRLCSTCKEISLLDMLCCCHKQNTDLMEIHMPGSSNYGLTYLKMISWENLFIMYHNVLYQSCSIMLLFRSTFTRCCCCRCRCCCCDKIDSRPTNS